MPGWGSRGVRPRLPVSLSGWLVLPGSGGLRYRQGAGCLQRPV
ncbi:Hypothetical protein SCLAV_p1479 (plasmid) [Streptomyces clavuligerus]|uniref:Uncharacterized protein n=1 Tax=Streptomyces clavuligerus TaxID=1901 RepID=D5SM18_STRCL|nr:Hypothetical protein SCLAV_p1479 [Streptomyces clavuligerus]